MGAPENAAGPDILRGTLDLLILQALSHGRAHGYDIARRIERSTNDVLAVGEGSLYPALHRLDARGWVATTWGTSDNNRQAKFYALTARGRGRLRVETNNWLRYAAAVSAALSGRPAD